MSRAVLFCRSIGQARARTAKFLSRPAHGCPMEQQSDSWNAHRVKKCPTGRLVACGGHALTGIIAP
jgi:hypothetical protein